MVMENLPQTPEDWAELGKRFVNIRVVDGNAFRGFQATVAKDGVYHEPYFAEWHPNALRRALRARNEIFSRLDTTARQVLLTPRRTGGDNKTAIDQPYLYRTTTVSRWTGEAYDTIMLQLIDLTTAARTNRTRRVYPGIVREAIALRDANVAAYNAVVAEYNRMARAEADRLAAREVESLRPMLGALQCFDPDRWRRALAVTFTEGIPDHRLAPTPYAGLGARRFLQTRRLKSASMQKDSPGVYPGALCPAGAGG